MLKRLIVTLVLSFFSLFLVFTHFVVAQGGDETTYPFFLSRKYPTNIMSLETSFVHRNVATISRVFPYTSYGSSKLFFPPYQSESDRIGYGKTSAQDTSSFKAGWYIDWDAKPTPAHPGGAEYARTIYFSVDTPRHNCAPPPDGAPDPATEMNQITANYTGTALIDNVAGNPGALWLIGNEFDARYNGSPIKAELYAELYHYFYTTIKSVDPTAKVAIGGVSQPSPLRMKYLDKILNHYQAKYGEPFPTDLWNIHFYYMNEWTQESCEWGAGIPPFTSPEDMPLAWSITVKEFEQGVPLDLQKLETNLRSFRQWMYERGYRDTPLIITEYGVLAGPEFGGPYTNENAALFLRNTMQMFRTITDVNTITGTLGMTGSVVITDVSTGYPADDYRLVQMWNWFSTHSEVFGGDLFDENGNLTVVGMAYGYNSLSNFTPYIDLELITPFSPVSATNVFTWDVFVNNRGNITATDTTISSTLVNYFDGTVVSNSVEINGDYPPRYRQAPLYLERAWPFTPPAAYTMTMVVNAHQTDVVTSNNRVEELFAVYPDLAVISFTNPTMIDWRKDGVTNFVTATVSVSAAIANVGNWTSTLTPMAMRLQSSDGAMSDTIALTVPILAPQDIFTLTQSWIVSDTGVYTASVLVNYPYLATRELFAHNNISTTRILIPNHWVFLPVVIKN